MSRAKGGAVKAWMLMMKSGRYLIDRNEMPSLFKTAEDAQSLAVEGELVVQVELRPIPAPKRKPRKSRGK